MHFPAFVELNFRPYELRTNIMDTLYLASQTLHYFRVFLLHGPIDVNYKGNMYAHTKVQLVCMQFATEALTMQHFGLPSCTA
jgi:hypothetical protein